MKRPIIVTILAIITFLNGLVQVLIGVVALVNRNDQQFLADAKATSSEVTSLGLVLLVVGLLSLLVALGLWRGSKLARLAAAVVAVGQIVGGIYTIAKLDNDQRASGIGMIIGSLLLLYLLFGTEKAKRFFA